MTTQIRSFIETFRGIIAVFVAVIAFGGSLSLVAGSGAIDLSDIEAAEAPQTIQAGLPTGRSHKADVSMADAVALQGLRGSDSEIGMGGPEIRPGELTLASAGPTPSRGRVEAPDRFRPQTRLEARLEPRVVQKNLKVRSGDTLEKILERAGAERQQAYYATRSLSEVHSARSLNVGQAVGVTLEFPVELPRSIRASRFTLTSRC